MHATASTRALSQVSFQTFCDQTSAVVKRFGIYALEIIVMIVLEIDDHPLAIAIADDKMYRPRAAPRARGVMGAEI